MHPVIAFAGTYGPGLAAWLFANADRLGDAFARVAGPVHRALTDPAAPLERVGPALVSLRDGQTEVLGVLHRQTDALQEISAAVDLIPDLGRTLHQLTALSVVGLGTTALSFGVLSLQLAALTRRLNHLAGRVRQVQGMIQARHRADLQAGLVLFEKGLGVEADQAAGLFTQAVGSLTDSSANYSQQLHAELASADHAYVWLVARHLTVSALGEAAVHLQLGQKGLAVKSLNAALAPLQAHARTVFTRTIGTDPARFLIPALAGHGITLEAVAELFRQAGVAGAVSDGERLSAADRFESLRGRLAAVRDPRFRSRAVVRRLATAWAEAGAAVEEVNRLKGLALAIDAYHSPDRTYSALVAEILNEMNRLRGEDAVGCVAFFPPSASSSKAGTPNPDPTGRPAI